ncbi:cupredoxin domain-containing protein (plasmid) [Nicoliella spurrieriana]|uniref:Cupredoxin domain-containing protein n=1 Tax=Nicoliella spurrieriana TaxID=2925830 RepID=A0A976RQA8_9LACO|nr:cupredoxin domain-containing protein [Nicoliella spurrieriana]UQS85917.1 cupredoxin domain-containing protein [Nicoliella spurrieriana]
MSEKEQVVTVTVDGGYQPAVVNLKQGVPAKLAFVRKSEQGCLDTVQSTDLGFNTELPLNQTKTVSVDTAQAGEFTFSCGMNMVSGKVVVK